MRLPTLLSSTAFVATALFSMNSTFAQCPGGRCPAPQPQHYNQNPYWQGNQNPNWQGNQTPNYRNDGGWDNQTYYQNQSQSNYYSREPNNSGFSNSSHMFDEDDAKTDGQDERNYLYSTNNNSNVTTPSQGYYFKQENNQSGNTNGQNAGPDSLIQHRVDEGLKNNYLRKNFENVNARVYNGNVTLSGTVETEQDREEVESRVRAIQGVKNVNDQIRVAPEAKVSSNENKRRSNIAVADVDTSKVDASKTATVTDHDLKKQIDDALKNNYVKKNYDTVIVTVTNGVVTVSGVIEEEKDRQEIRDRIQKIKGVSNINDRLQVSALKK